METLGRLGVGGLWCVSLLIKVLCALSDAWDWGNGFSSVDGVICLVHFCLTLGSCGHGLILVVGGCWFHLIRELWSGGGLLIVPWFWRFGDVIVIHWLTEWSDSGGGVVLGESWDEDPVWLGWWLLYLMWIMEFGLTVWLWLCRRAAGRGSWYYWCSSVIQVKVDSPSLIEVCDGCSSRLVVVVNDEWRFVGFRAIVGIRDLVTI